MNTIKHPLEPIVNRTAFNTTSLMKHLKIYHSAKQSSFTQILAEVAPKQHTPDETFEKERQIFYTIIQIINTELCKETKKLTERETEFNMLDEQHIIV